MRTKNIVFHLYYLYQIWITVGSCIVMIGFHAALAARTFPVADYDSFNKAQQQAQKGDTLLWTNGTYYDIVLDLLKSGVNILAEEPGKVVFSGQTNLTIFGDSMVLSGFQFRDGSTEGDIVKVAGSHVTLVDLNFTNFSSHYYLNILPGAQYTEVYHCNFEKKPDDRTTSVFQIQVHQEIPGYHHVSYCSFKNFTAPPDAGGDYGIEALRIGYSFQASFVGRNIIEYCYFTKCNGDGEIISSKARENIYRYNTFEDNGASHFTLRHGSDNAVYGNFFLKGAGVRIKEGQNQMVYNNYFQTGDWFSINLLNHPADPLDDIVIAHNSFVSSGPILGGEKGEHQPINVVIANNIFLNPTTHIIEKSTGSERFYGNVVDESDRELPPGFIRTMIDYSENEDGLFQLNRVINTGSTNQSDWMVLDIPSLDDDPQIVLDILQQKRESGKQGAGCQVAGDSQRLKPYVSAENTGPSYLKM